MLCHEPQTGRITGAGRTALLFSDSLHAKKVDACEKASFEYLEWIVECGVW